jgi:hypothetical protein
MTMRNEVSGSDSARGRQSSKQAAAGTGLSETGESEAKAPAGTVKRQKASKHPYTKFKRLENRQKVVEQNRRAVYAHLDKITQENIKLAKKGNAAIAKFLFEFAGINQLPALADASSKRRKAVGECEDKADDDPTKAVLSFYKKLGMTPPRLRPPKAVEGEEGEQQAALS